MCPTVAFFVPLAIIIHLVVLMRNYISYLFASVYHNHRYISSLNNCLGVSPEQ